MEPPNPNNIASPYATILLCRQNATSLIALQIPLGSQFPGTAKTSKSNSKILCMNSETNSKGPKLVISPLIKIKSI